jgi:hypothetical protein
MPTPPQLERLGGLQGPTPTSGANTPMVEQATSSNCAAGEQAGVAGVRRLARVVTLICASKRMAAPATSGRRTQAALTAWRVA